MFNSVPPNTMESPTEGSMASKVSANVEPSVLNLEQVLQSNMACPGMTRKKGDAHSSTGIFDHQVLRPAIEESPSKETSASGATRLAYNTGYGDFCFGRLSDRFESVAGRDGDDDYWREGSNAIPIADLNSFERSGSFPFSKLPIEIRDKIYGFLLDPLFIHSPDSKRYILMYLDEDDNANLHPSRRSAYNLTIVVYKNNEKLYEDNHDFFFIEWLPQAATVSTHFRAELGRFIWSNVHIHTNGQPYDMWLLPQMIYERPAACQGISSLRLDLDMQCSDSATWESDEFGEWCASISKGLAVEELEFLIILEGKQFLDLAKGHGRYSGIAASKCLRVKKSFRVEFNILPDSNFPSNQDEEKYAEELEKEYGPGVTRMILPNTLRNTLRNTQTEMAKYLESRPTDSSPTSVEEPEVAEGIVM